MYNRRFDRRFLMLKQESNGYGLNNKDPEGSIIIEIRNGKGKLSAYAKGLKPLNTGTYRIYLIKTKDKLTGVFAGLLNVGKGGIGEAKWNFDPDNVGESGVTIEQFDVIAILANRLENQSDIIAPLVGYREGLVHWKHGFKEFVKKEQKTDESKGTDDVVYTGGAPKMSDTVAEIKPFAEESTASKLNEHELGTADDSGEILIQNETIAGKSDVVEDSNIENAIEPEQSAMDANTGNNISNVIKTTETTIDTSQENANKSITYENSNIPELPDSEAAEATADVQPILIKSDNELERDIKFIPLTSAGSDISYHKTLESPKTDEEVKFAAKEDYNTNMADPHLRFKALYNKFNTDMENIINNDSALEKQSEIPAAEKKDLINDIDDIVEMYEKNAKMNPFPSLKGVDWIRISEEELSYLPARACHLLNHPFVFLGYKKYKHYILGRTQKDGYEKLYFGLPDIYRSTDKYKANTLGFSRFKCLEDKMPSDGEHGYWIMEIHNIR